MFSPTRNLGVGLVPLLLAACAVPPPMAGTPGLRAPASLATASLDGPADARWPAADWWRTLGDAQLAALIDEGLAASPSLAEADARLRQADGMARSAGAALAPQLSTGGSAGASKQSYNLGIPPAFVPHGWNSTGQASGNLAFDPDLFGRNHAELAAATSERAAARIEASAARTALATAIATAYADLGRLAALRDVAAAALKVRQETARLVAERVTNGLDTRAELREAEAGVATAEADLAASDAALALARNRIAALLGAGPDRAATIVPPAPAQFHAMPLPAHLALDLVGRRADIAAARARAEAAAARVGAARAAYFPDINLTGLLGAQSLGLANLTAIGSETGQAQAAISLPLFTGGRLSGNYAGARGAYDAAVARYNATLIDAVRDVADAAAQTRALAQELDAAQTAVLRSEEAFALAKRRYAGGLSPYLAVLSAEEALLRNRQLLADSQGRVLALNVNLIRALGGGFSA